MKKPAEYECAVCGGRVSLNRGDYFECHSCNQQFGTGDEPTLKQTHLRSLSGGQPLLVVYADIPLGTGDFR